MEKLNKKGDVFILLIIVGVILILGISAVTYSSQNVNVNKNYAIGAIQLRIVNLSSEADETVFYLDKSL